MLKRCQKITGLKLMDIRDLLLDLRNLLMEFGSSDVNGMTPHLYLSIIPFWKKKSIFRVELKRTVRIEQQVVNRPGLQIGILGTAGALNSVVYSNDGTRIVSGSSDRTVRIWDATTGTQI